LLHDPFLVRFGIIAGVSGDGGANASRVPKIPMTALAFSILKAGPLEVTYSLADLARHIAVTATWKSR
jgi:hypothetical protein